MNRATRIRAKQQTLAAQCRAIAHALRIAGAEQQARRYIAMHYAALQVSRQVARQVDR